MMMLTYPHNAMNGSVTNPNSRNQMVVQGTSREHTLLSHVGFHSSRKWYVETTLPNAASTMAYGVISRCEAKTSSPVADRRAARHRFTNATPDTIANEYIAMRWYQHSLQGL